ncbi:MAG: PilW family protein [Kofleriaceae bacterium]
MKRQRGFTLIELMISLVLFSFVIAGVLAVAVSMSQGYRDQRQATQAEAAARIPLDFITDAIRQASPGNGSNQIWDGYVCGSGGTSWGIEVFNNVGTGSAANTDRLDVIYASGAVLTSSRVQYTSASQTTLDVSDASQFGSGDAFVLSDTNKAVLLRVTGVSGNTLTLQAQSCTGSNSSGYDKGSLVIRAQHATFYIDYLDNGSGGYNPTLMFDPDADSSTSNSEPIAEGVEDLQLVKLVDRSGNNYIEPEGTTTATQQVDEWLYNVTGDGSGSATWGLRGIRVNLVARTLGGLIGNLKSYNRPKVEDHAAAAANTDNYRRRVLRATVDIRNLSVSP